MFFIVSASPKVKDIGDGQMMICPSCGRFSRMTPYVEKQEIRLFFLPIARFRPKYFARASCCHEHFILDPEVGRSLERGELITMDESDLEAQGTNTITCAHCGGIVEEHHRFCPHCGKDL